MNSANRATLIDIKKWLEPFLKRERLQEYSVDISGCTERGDNYLGDITFVDVSGRCGTEEKKYNFVVKCGKKSTQLRDLMPIRTAFENEIYFYSEVLPVFTKFQQQKGIKEPFDNVPKCFDTLIMDDMEVIIMENIKMSGFELHDRWNSMNKDHILKVLKTYGKFHAISFALRDQQPELFKSLSEKLTDIFKIFSEKFQPPEDHNLYKVLIQLAKEKHQNDLIDKLKLLNELSKTHNDITDPSDPFAVILHGDCWNNNFMFQYKDDAKMELSDVRLLDFQISRLASPVYDLSYFLFTCLSEKDIEDFDEIVDVYYESFSNFLRMLGSDPDKMFPYEEFMNQWKKFSVFGLVLLPSIAKICVSEKDEVKDLAEVAESGDDFVSTFTSSVKNSDHYAERTLPIIKLAVKKGFL